jgi:hypothetical protein
MYVNNCEHAPRANTSIRTILLFMIFPNQYQTSAGIAEVDSNTRTRISGLKSSILHCRKQSRYLPPDDLGNHRIAGELQQAGKCILVQFTNITSLTIHTSIQTHFFSYRPQRLPGILATLDWMGQNRTLVPLVGFELTTYRLQGGCSTN